MCITWNQYCSDDFTINVLIVPGLFSHCYPLEPFNIADIHTSVNTKKCNSFHSVDIHIKKALTVNGIVYTVLTFTLQKCEWPG